MTVTISDVIKQLTKSITPIENSVDKLLYGKSEKVVSKLAFCFMPTFEVLQQAVDKDVNLLICHEGLFHSHTKKELSSVAEKKIHLIESSGIAIFRLHDYVHRYKPDGIMEGMLHKLEWKKYVEINYPTATTLNLPSMTVGKVINDVKRKLNIPYVRYVGNLSTTCKRAGILVGYRGSGSRVIPLFENNKLDLVIYGEGPEWETPEYVRDANSQGIEKALIILGHAESEEPGMEFMAEYIQKAIPQISVSFISSKSYIHVL
ncbi:Nif3-like dinuclear metal center hexameric protein [Saliterribacillus persicus]|uniref:GTP cyclohydrolase 1 type 2 homolog n=1 Tax=Saliterribacillus persicus TaxID=930114 RepID=A0A368Y3G1_9BACI|nr:Nif3-like dinuclear metal center hexameric protein [Saliterribacillus persicus]RCW74811.1 putative NIF3 family GTP cyclohydrolase 1 type 2 [Saliterribacillus persicus]